MKNLFFALLALGLSASLFSSGCVHALPREKATTNGGYSLYGLVAPCYGGQYTSCQWQLVTFKKGSCKWWYRSLGDGFAFNGGRARSGNFCKKVSALFAKKDWRSLESLTPKK